MCAMLEQIAVLLSEGLYEDVKFLIGPLITISEQNEKIINISERLSLLVYLGDAHYGSNEYRKAESIFSRALQLRKSVSRARGLPTDVEIRWKIYLCFNQLRLYREAILILESVPEKSRTAAINLAMGKSYLRTGSEKLAQNSFRDCLKKTHGLSLEAAKGLIECKTPLQDVLILIGSLLDSGTFSPVVTSLLSRLREAAVQCYGRAYKEAYNNLISFQSENLLMNSVDVMAITAENLYRAGEYDQAETLFSKVHQSDQKWLQYMDSYAELLHRKSQHFNKLYRLAQCLQQVSEAVPETWIAFGYVNLVNKKHSRAMFFAHKAVLIDPNSMHALLLRGNISLDNDKESDATIFFNDAKRLSHSSFEVMFGLVRCHMEKHRYKAAKVKVEQMFVLLGKTPRTMALYGHVLAHDNPVKAIEILSELCTNYSDKVSVTTVATLAELYLEKQKYTDAVVLLRQWLSRECQNSRLLTLLGDALGKSGDTVDALTQYNLAIQLDPTNRKAQDGIKTLENITAPDDANFHAAGDNYDFLTGNNSFDNSSDLSEY